MNSDPLRRIFVAVPVSKALQSEIENWRMKYEHLPVRWLAGKNLHITLVPPWYERDISGIVGKLGSTGKGIAPFEMEFRRVDFGPDPRRPRLIWAEGEVPKELASLKSEAERALGKEPEKRPFKLHLTVARFRPEMFSSFPVKKLEEEILWRERANSFVLMEAHLSPQGADYEVVQEFPLL